MPDKAVPGPVGSNASIREAVSINTAKIFDCCRDKDCVDELRVYPTISSQAYIDNAISIRPKSAELLFVNVNVEPVSFNRGYYTVDCTYFYRVTAETFPGAQLCRGLAVFDKRVMLFGSEGSVKTFSSDSEEGVVTSDDQPARTSSSRSSSSTPWARISSPWTTYGAGTSRSGNSRWYGSSATRSF